MNLVEKSCRKILYSKLSGITDGYLEFEEAFLKGHTKVHGFGNPGSGLKARLRILNPDAYPKMVFSGSVGAGESYFLNEWECSDLTAMIRILLRNRETLESIDHGSSAIQNPLQKIYHGLHRNTLKGAKKISKLTMTLETTSSSFSLILLFCTAPQFSRVLTPLLPLLNSKKLIESAASLN